MNFQVERLSLETDSWFILCAQLPGSGPTYHYTSPRLRREALEDATSMVSTFQTTTYGLNLAKRKDAKEIVDNYEKMLTKERERIQVAEAEADKSLQREKLLQTELEAQKALVEAYRTQLASKFQVENLSKSVMPENNNDNNQ
jgi:hypothetical protein